ncbi:uncharacterized protein LOC133193950 [Saccostrea echinata]|uniref:uncharacterized protein LOC133193950 n=1 Tax=Saccostrea echinata TaxID=191078 RepID=UPI002A7ED050|nr:uncharacterized protein LOC133193950 [Saccostrea echinata]
MKSNDSTVFHLDLSHKMYIIHTGTWYLSVSPTTIIGENNVTLSCDYHEISNRNNIIPEVVMEIRQNNNRDWKELAKTNITGSYILKTYQNLGIYISPYSCSADSSYISCSVRIVMSFTLSRCTIDPHSYSVFRCKVSNGSQSPKEIQPLTIIKSSGKRPGDVVQLQCIGEIENINGIPSENIRWCKKIKGKFTKISLQDPPKTVFVSSSKDGCTNIQKSEIFYHIMQSDVYLEIICESGYNKFTRKCGKGTVNSTQLIRTNTEEEGQWKISPLLIYDENGVIDEQYFNTHGIGRTFHLLCSASSFTSNEQINTINWCVKKTDKANWTKVVSQEDEIKSSTNNSGEIIMFSRITYHITEYDKVVTFTCEISASSSSSCGSGLSFSSRNIWINAHQTMPSETNRSSASVAVLSVLLCLVLIAVVALVVITYRRGELTTFDTKNEKEFEDDTQGLYEEPECNLAVRRLSFYENEALKNEKLNEVETTKHMVESEICDYDELQIEGEQQDYEDLKL